MTHPFPYKERRLYTRLEKRIPVNVYYNSHCICHCYTANISVGGVLLDIDDLGLTENSLVEITFGVKPWHSLHEVRIPAIVVWRTEAQLAISFETLQKDTEELLQGHIETIVYEDKENK